MQKQLYPSEVAMNSIELHWTKNTIRSQAIYIIILAIVIGSFICLPFIYVNITVQGTGLIRPETEKSEVKSLISSTIVKVMVKEGEARLKDGSLAGSTLNLHKSVQNMVNYLNVPLHEAVKMASLSPAKALGIEERKGSIEVGKDADMILFDHNLEITNVIKSGNIIVK